MLLYSIYVVYILGGLEGAVSSRRLSYQVNDIKFFSAIVLDLSKGLYLHHHIKTIC